MGEWELRHYNYQFSIVDKDSGRLICRCDTFKDKAILIIIAHNKAMRAIRRMSDGVQGIS